MELIAELKMVLTKTTKFWLAGSPQRWHLGSSETAEKPGE